MREAVLQHLGAATIVIKAAAVADYRVAQPSATKIKSKKDEGLTLELAPNPDILAESGRAARGAFVVGFAAETNDVRAQRARQARRQGHRPPRGQRREPPGHRLRRRRQRGAAPRPLGRRRRAARDDQDRGGRRHPRPRARAARRRDRPAPEHARRRRLAAMETRRGARRLRCAALAEHAPPSSRPGRRRARAARRRPRPTPLPPIRSTPRSAARPGAARAQGCQLCKLCKSRTTIVFGSGNPRARLMVVGEGPGEEEDKQGLPFVGRAGQLLTKMLAVGVGFDRERDCYIANVVKCRPERQPQSRAGRGRGLHPVPHGPDRHHPAGGDPDPRQLRHADAPRHQGRHHQAAGQGVSVPVRASSSRPSIPPSCCAIPGQSSSAWRGTISSCPPRIRPPRPHAEPRPSAATAPSATGASVIADVVFDIPLRHVRSPMPCPTGCRSARGQRVERATAGAGARGHGGRAPRGRARGAAGRRARGGAGAGSVAGRARRSGGGRPRRASRPWGSTLLSLLPPAPRRGARARPSLRAPSPRAGLPPRSPELWTGVRRDADLVERAAGGRARRCVIAPDREAAARWAERLDGRAARQRRVPDAARRAAWLAAAARPRPRRRGHALGAPRAAAAARDARPARRARSRPQAAGRPALHSRELLVRRAALEGSRLLLLSATPVGGELVARRRTDQFRRRAHDAGPWPEIVDRRHARHPAQSPAHAAADARHRGHGAGRRAARPHREPARRHAGSATSAAHVLRCPDCGVALALSREQGLARAAALRAAPSPCPSAARRAAVIGSRRFGWGAERVEASVRRRFPKLTVSREPTREAQVLIGAARPAARRFRRRASAPSASSRSTAARACRTSARGERTFALLWAAAEATWAAAAASSSRRCIPSTTPIEAAQAQIRGRLLPAGAQVPRRARLPALPPALPRSPCAARATARRARSIAECAARARGRPGPHRLSRRRRRARGRSARWRIRDQGARRAAAAARRAARALPRAATAPSRCGRSRDGSESDGCDRAQEA